MLHTYPNVLVISDKPTWATTIAQELLGDSVGPPTLGTGMGHIVVSNKYFKSTVGLHIGCTGDPVMRATMGSAHGVVLIVAPPRAGYRQHFNEMFTRMSSYLCQLTENRGSIHDVGVEMRLCVVVMANDFPEKDTVIREWQTMCLDNQFELIERAEDVVTFQGLSKIPLGSLAQRMDAEYTSSSRVLECIHETNWSKVDCRVPQTPLLPVYVVYAESDQDDSLLDAVADRARSRLGLLIGDIEPHNARGLYIPCVVGSFAAMIPPSQKNRSWMNCPSRFAIVVCRGPMDSSVLYDTSVIGTSEWKWCSNSEQVKNATTHNKSVVILRSIRIKEKSYVDAIWSHFHNQSTVVLEGGILGGEPFVDCGDQWDEGDGYLGWARVAELLEIDIEIWLANYFTFESVGSNKALFLYGSQPGTVPNLFDHPSIEVCPSSVPRRINLHTKYFTLSGTDAVWVFEMSEVQFTRRALRRSLRSELHSVYRWHFTNDVMDEPVVNEQDRLQYQIICSALSTSDWLCRYVLPYTKSLESEEPPNVVVINAAECDGSDYFPTRESDRYTMPFVACVDPDDDLVMVVQDAVLSAPWHRSVAPEPASPNIAPPTPSPQQTLPFMGCELPPYLFVDPVSMQSCCYPLNPFVHQLPQLSDLRRKLSNRGIVAASDELITQQMIRHISIDFELSRSYKFALEYYIDEMTLSELMKSVKLNGSKLTDVERQRQAGLLAEAMGELVMM